MEHVFVADTNLFFECKRLEEIPWSDLKCDPIIIALTKPVLGEIDKHKNGHGRTKRRAMEISKRIRTMIETGQSETIIRQASPKVILRRFPIVNPDPNLEKQLDFTQNDDRIIGILSAISKDRTYASVSLITDDTLAASTAQSINFPIVLIPDHWKRPPEQTKDEKKIANLETKLSAYVAQEPNIQLRLLAESGSEPHTTHHTACPIAEADIGQLISTLQTRHPMQEDFLAPARKILTDGREITHTPPAPEDVEEYQNKTYPDWLAQCRTVFENLHKKHPKNAPSVRLVFGVTNIGTRPASQMRVSFEARGDILLLRASEENAENPDLSTDSEGSSVPHLPLPPSPPSFIRTIKQPTNPSAKQSNVRLGGVDGPISIGSTFKNLNILGQTLNVGRPILDNLDRVLGPQTEFLRSIQNSTARLEPIQICEPILSFPNVLTPKGHNKESFYYDEWAANIPTKRGELTCELFRHLGEEELFEVEVEFPENCDVKGAIFCRVQADNLTKPSELYIPVGKTEEEFDLVKKAEEMVEKCGA